MAIVVERSYAQPRVFTVARTSGGAYSYTLLDGRDRSQTGFRSRNLTSEEQEGISAKPLTWGESLSVVKLHDDMLRSSVHSVTSIPHRSRCWPVNDRDYRETKYIPTGNTMTYETRTSRTTPWFRISCQGAHGASALLSTAFPSAPTTSQQQSIAGQLLRGSRPSQMAFNLARFSLEQREAPLLFKAANYMPRSRKELGGAYLNFLFGLKPTGSDLGYLAELVLRADSGIRTLLESEKVRERRGGRRVLFEDSGFVQKEIQNPSEGFTGQSFNIGFHTQSYAALVNYSGTSFGNMVYPTFITHYTRKQVLKTFATWEYFVPQPENIHGRLATYRRNAKLLLSSAKVDEGVVYELTPWSWLADWFVDFGGLLRYQNDTVANSIVATGCGYSLREEYIASTTLASYRILPGQDQGANFGARDLVHVPTTSKVVAVRHTRRSGNPYSIMPTWNLSTQQSAILGALGLSRGAGVSIKR